MWLSLAVNVILSTFKNPKKKAEVKKVMLELRDAINAAYPGE